MRTIALGLGVLLLAGCATAEVEMRPVESWSGRLEATQADDLRAAASVNSGARETAVSVAVAGAQANATHPWHIHRGTCGSGGAIVGAANAYPPLQVGSNGQARATARVNVGLDAMQQYYVNIHRSPQDLGTIVGCIQLRR